MTGLLWLVPALPLASAIALLLLRLPRPVAATFGAGSVGLAALVALLASISFSSSGETAYELTLWTWMSIGTFNPGITLHLDALSMVMMGVITGVGFLIHLYSTEYMAHDDGMQRFFAYMNLFVASMLLLVLGDNLLLLYLGWEGVGLCSYLLIGFWYQDSANGAAAQKAFIVTRIGDAAMALGLFLLFAELGTLDIDTLLARATEMWQPGNGTAIAAAALLLSGAVGKSAQVPLQTWLPDAMAGPTPVSALIHAATMVTAGVYLIARMHPIYELAPPVMTAVALAGAATLLIAGISALGQSDMKRVLAYSTISQIGYMFLALGVGAWSAAVFHLMTHAFFKALLFLAAGAVMLRLHHETDIFKMGGLRKKLPAAFWSMLIGGSALASLPLVTAGFYSKDVILLEAWQNGSPNIGGTWLWLAGLIGALLTALYTFRMIFIAFFGEAKQDAQPGTEHSWRVLIPLGVLAVLSIIGGFIHLPLESVLPGAPGEHHGTTATILKLIAGVTSLAGIGLAWLMFGRGEQTQSDSAIARFARSGCGFDWLYDRLLVRPVVAIARLNRDDILDGVFTIIAWGNTALHRGLSATQTGNLRWYASAIAGGVIILFALAQVL